jgi:hypothetical protein
MTGSYAPGAQKKLIRIKKKIAGSGPQARELLECGACAEHPRL